MTKRDKFCRFLGGLNSSDPRHGEDIAFGDLTLTDRGNRVGSELDQSGSGRLSTDDRLFGYIDHSRGSIVPNVSKIAHAQE